MFCVAANFLPGTAAAVREGRPIVQANKGRRGYSHSHKSFASGAEEDADTLVCLVSIYPKAFPMRSHHSRSIMKEDGLD